MTNIMDYFVKDNVSANTSSSNPPPSRTNSTKPSSSKLANDSANNSSNNLAKKRKLINLSCSSGFCWLSHSLPRKAQETVSRWC